MNKVEKLRGIIGKKIAIWCDTKENDEEFCKIVNKMCDKRIGWDDSSLYLENSYYVIFLDENENIVVEYHFSTCEILDYQVIPFDEFFKDESKSIEDYTLKELKNHCAKFENCNDECEFKEFCDEYIGSILPESWEFENETKLQLTKSEIEILKAVKVLYRRCHKLIYDYDNEDFTNDINCGLVKISSDRLPSLSYDKEYNIDELLEGVE